MVQITHVHMNSGVRHEHIVEVRWRNPDTNDTGTSTREAVVTWLRESDGNQAYVSDRTRRVFVGVVNASPPYIRTYADGVWTDNLLALPRF